MLVHTNTQNTCTELNTRIYAYHMEKDKLPVGEQQQQQEGVGCSMQTQIVLVHTEHTYIRNPIESNTRMYAHHRGTDKLALLQQEGGRLLVVHGLCSDKRSEKNT